MLANWSLINFKSFLGKTSLPFAPLTFFCGANSSGKSSVVQSILLIKQTIQYAPTTRPIALNGPLVRLGTFSEIQNSKTKKNTEKKEAADQNIIGLGWEIREATPDSSPEAQVEVYQEAIRSVTVSFKFDTQGISNEEETLEIQPSLRETEVSASYVDPNGLYHTLDVAARRSKSPKRKIRFNTSPFSELINPFAYTINEIDSETKLRALSARPEAKIVGCIPQHFFPAETVVRYDRSKDIARQIVEQITGARPRRLSTPNIPLPSAFTKILMETIQKGSLPEARIEEIERVLFFSHENPAISSGDIIRRFINLPPSTRRSVQAALMPRSNELLNILYQHFGVDLTLTRARVDILRSAVELNDSFFRFSVRYLGPLRDEPRSLYPLQALASPTDVGPKGELTAAVLHLNAKRQIDFVPTKCFQVEKIEIKTEKTRLRDAVVEWLIYLGIAVDLQTSEKGKFGHEFRVKTNVSSDFQDLTNVGVGVSQVIPIVVTCLLAPVGATIILEQPELHLHPAVQARLADFFISMTSLGKQCIIETHGEYLIERMRLRIAGDLADQVVKNTKIYFFEQKDGETRCRDVIVNRFGAIEDWPDDFFDQSQKESERIVLNAIARRKLEKNSNATENK